MQGFVSSCRLVHALESSGIGYSVLSSGAAMLLASDHSTKTGEVANLFMSSFIFILHILHYGNVHIHIYIF